LGGRVSRKQGWISVERTLKGRWVLLFTLAVNALRGDQLGKGRLLLVRVNEFVAFHQNSHGPFGGIQVPGWKEIL